MITLIEHPGCSTCKKAAAFLQQQGVSFGRRDIRLQNPTAEELRAWQRQSGLPLRRFFNTSGMLYRQMKLKDRLDTLSEDEQLALLAADGMLVKRPLLLFDGGVLVGFSQPAWQAALQRE